MKIKKKKIILIFTSVVLVLGFVVYFLPNVVADWRWQKAIEASGSLPYQIGLTNAIITPCVPTTVAPPPLPPAACLGGTPLCNVLDSIKCALYSQVSGMPAGGTGNMALFSNIAIAKAGLTPGGQLIAGGMMPTAMDSGVLASAGGCSGCMAKANFKDKIFDWVDKYIIAGIIKK